ncbi:cell wall protein [Stackebrandtia soli]|uniref:cell wall protein n=1 Tax=Stackebrandtia soli TaxID=1892856 RepID=UPI0039E82A24
MSTFNRRSLLAGAVLGGTGIVGASALGGFGAEDAFASPTLSIEPGMRDPEFAEGLISSIDGDVISARGSDGLLWRVRVTDATSVWKLTPTTFDAVKVGDGMYARGPQLDDGSLAADAVWANIVNLKVHLVSMRSNRLEMDHNGSRVIGHVIPGTTAAVYNGTPAIADVSMVKVDTHVQILGAWIPGTNEVEIATIYSHR